MTPFGCWKTKVGNMCVPYSVRFLYFQAKSLKFWHATVTVKRWVESVRRTDFSFSVFTTNRVGDRHASEHKKIEFSVTSKTNKQDRRKSNGADNSTLFYSMNPLALPTLNTLLSYDQELLYCAHPKLVPTPINLS